MRLKRSRIGSYFHKKKETIRDGEGTTGTQYGKAEKFSAEMWCAGGKLQAEKYGDRLPYIRNIRINEKYHIETDEKGRQHYIIRNGTDVMEGDGLCLYVAENENPDYMILSIKPERFLRIEAEKI